MCAVSYLDEFKVFITEECFTQLNFSILLIYNFNTLSVISSYAFDQNMLCAWYFLNSRFKPHLFLQ